MKKRCCTFLILIHTHLAGNERRRSEIEGREAELLSDARANPLDEALVQLILEAREVYLQYREERSMKSKWRSDRQQHKTKK